MESREGGGGRSKEIGNESHVMQDVIEGYVVHHKV